MSQSKPPYAEVSVLSTLALKGALEAAAPGLRAEYHATQAGWLLLPVRSDLVAPGAEPSSPDAVNLSFAITRERPGIEILFQNTAGVVWRKKTAESR